MKKLAFLVILVYILNVNFVFSAVDQVIGAKELLEKISNNFKQTVKDYEADFKWIQSDNVQEGKLYFKNSQKLRLNFTNPPNQVICTNGYDLWFYMPAYNYLLTQKLLSKEKKIVSFEEEESKKKNKKDTNKNENQNPDIVFFAPIGFDKLLSDYAVEFNESKTLINYNGHMVYSFKLIRWKTSKNGINVIYLFVEPNGIIRKFEGITASYRKITIELNNIKINTGIDDKIFDYNPPSHVRILENFMSGEN